MSEGRQVVIGVGNEYRRDDGIGPAVIAQLQQFDLDGTTLIVADGDPSRLLDAWSGVALAVIVDAVLCEPSAPGQIHRSTLSSVQPDAATASTHGLGIPDAIRLADALDRAPGRLVVFAVEAADLGFGLGLTPAVADALPDVVRAVLAEVGDTRSSTATSSPH